VDYQLIRRFTVIIRIVIFVFSLFLLSSCGWMKYTETLDSTSSSVVKVPDTVPVTTSPVIKPTLKIQKESIPSNLTITEGTTLVVYVALSSSSTIASQFTIQLEGSAGEVASTYYNTSQSTLTIPAGETAGHITILSLDDNAYHPDSTWSLKLISQIADIDSTDSLGFTLKDNDSNSAAPSVPPTALLAGLPSDPSNLLSFNVSVSGAASGTLTTYQYKMGPSLSTVCSSVVGYSTVDIASSTSIIENLGVYADGLMTLCVIGKDASGNSQPYASATTYTWVKDTTPPTATLSGTPTATNNTTALNITVAGTDVIAYQYKVGVTGSTDCTSATGYSGDTLISQNITSSLSAIADGSITLCVLGKDAVGNEQALSNTTTATWTKDTTAPTITSVTSSKANGGLHHRHSD
jgi:hypothetical protein